MVADRTASLQTVLDSTGDGLLSVDLKRNNFCLSVRGAVTNWFGVPEVGTTVWDYLAVDAFSKDSLAMAFRAACGRCFFRLKSQRIKRRSRLNAMVKRFAIEYREIREQSRLVSHTSCGARYYG